MRPVSKKRSHARTIAHACHRPNGGWRGPRYRAAHGTCCILNARRPLRRHAIARMAPAPPVEPARPLGRSRGFDAPPQLRRDRPRDAEPQNCASPGRSARRAAARTQLLAHGRRLRADVRREPAGRPGDGGGARGGRADPEGARAVSGARGRPALEPAVSQRRSWCAAADGHRPRTAAAASQCAARKPAPPRASRRASPTSHSGARTCSSAQVLRLAAEARESA